MNRMLAFWKARFQNARLCRIWLETIVLCMLLTGFVVLLYAPINETAFIIAFFFLVNPSCALYSALRLRPAQGNRVRQMWLELLWLTVTTALVTGTGLLTFVMISGDSIAIRILLPPSIILCAVLLFSHLFFRTMLRLWVWWGELYKRHLLWSLMNSHLVAVAVLEALIIVPLFCILAFWATPNWEWTNLPNLRVGQFFLRINMMLPLLGAAILAACVLLVALIPVSALVSYFLSRRIKQRLDALIAAAQAAGNGDYRVRVPVVGQDEIATLQTDFNAMIARLETNVNALQEERAKVVRLLDQRHELVAHVSHDLRTPLATIRAYLESAQRRNQDASITPLDAAELDVLQRESETLQLLIDDLFTLSRAETDHLSLQIEATDLLILIQRIVATVAPLAWRSKRIEISAQLPATFPLVQADSQRLDQALRNLIHNGLRHTLPGGIIVLSVKQNGDCAEIQVRDSGEGIDADDLPHIWERFYHGANNGGSGLGLALVKSLVEAMHGSVAVQTVRGEGTCFTLSLPLSEPHLATPLSPLQHLA